MQKKELLFPQNCLRDLEFQDWLADVQLTQRKPVTNNDLELIPQQRLKPSRNVRLFLEQLSDMKGYLVPRDDLARTLYGSTSNDNLHATSTMGSFVQKRLMRPGAIHVVRGLGWGVGIDKFKLTKDQVPITFRLWKDMWSFVSRRELGLSIYGVDDEFTNRTIAQHIFRLSTDALSTSLVRILNKQHFHSKHQSYKLVGVDDIEKPRKPKLEEHLPPYLAFDFQDWLAREDVQLLVRKANGRRRHITSRLKEGERLENLPAQVAAALNQNIGYIIPYDYLSILLYGTSEERKKVVDIIGRLRNKLRNPQDLYTSLFMGVGLDVSRLHVSRNPLKILFELWKQDGQPLTVEELSNIIYGRYNPETHNFILSNLHELRDDMVGSPYTIKGRTSLTPGKSSYHLQKRDTTVFDAATQ